MDTSFDLLSISVTDSGGLTIVASWWICLLLLSLIVVAFWTATRARRYLRHFELVNLQIELGNIGSITLQPNTKDIQIAHGVWTELVTRKAALPIDDQHDVILEVYNSWYALFGRVRQLVSEIPGNILRREESTQKLVIILTESLNKGLRPHLTQWQAKFRNWYDQHKSQLNEMSPQELQRQFPEYEALISDMKEVNAKMTGYAAELQKIIYGDVAFPSQRER